MATQKGKRHIAKIPENNCISAYFLFKHLKRWCKAIFNHTCLQSHHYLGTFKNFLDNNFIEKFFIKMKLISIRSYERIFHHA